MSSKNKTIKYKKLLEHLLNKANDIIGDLEFPIEEYPAVLSHFLQSNCTHLIYGDSKFRKRLTNEIHSFFGGPQGKIFNDKVRTTALPKPLNYHGISYRPPQRPKFTFIDLL